MSSYLVFYRLEKVKEKLPDVINTSDLEYAYIEVNDAPEWIKKIGVVRKLYYYHTDFFKAGRELFGKTPDSVRIVGIFNGSYDLMYGSDHETVHKDQLDNYTSKIEFDAYVYNKVRIVEIRSIYMLNLKTFDGLNFSREDILKLVEQCINKDDAENTWGSSSYKDTAYGLMYMYFYMKNKRCKMVAELV